MPASPLGPSEGTSSGGTFEGLPPEDRPGDGADDVARRYTPTALPPRRARALAFAAILVAGACGGLIGWAVIDLQCGADPTTAGVVDEADGCTTWAAVGALIGAVLAAGGVGIISVLVLRAMVEWRRTLDVEDLPPA